MARHLFSRITMWTLIGISAFSYDHALADRSVANCLGTLFQSFGTRTRSQSLVRFGEEVKRDGMKRFLIKELPKVEVPPDTKLWGVLRGTEKSDEKWFWRVGTDLTQFFPRQITKAVYKKSYDFIPFTRLYEGTEKFILRGKTLTTVPKVALTGYVGYKTFEYSGWGLADRFLTAKEKEKAEQDLDYLMAHDYRFRNAKTRDEALSIKAQYVAYHEVMKSLSDQGIRYDDPLATLAILSDSTVVRRVGPLFEDVAHITDPSFYQGKPYIDATRLKPKDAELVHELMKVNHLKIMFESSASDLFSNSGKIPEQLKPIFEKDEFYQSLKEKVQTRQLTPEQARYAFIQKVEWASRLKMFEKVGVTPFQVSKDGSITRDTLHLSDLESEILTGISTKH